MSGHKSWREIRNPTAMERDFKQVRAALEAANADGEAWLALQRIEDQLKALILMPLQYRMIDDD